jgi:hypothetical protein
MSSEQKTATICRLNILPIKVFLSCNDLFKPGVLLLIAILFLYIASPAYAWVYSEHRDIALQAVEKLDEKSRAHFDQLWKESRIGFEKKLCEDAADTEQAEKTECLDWAAFSAIAGDHSCSSKEMLETIVDEQWILEVANISAQLKAELAKIPVDDMCLGDKLITDSTDSIIDQVKRQENRAKRLNTLRRADTKLLRADPSYTTRADANTAHFLIARPDSTTTTQDYARLALREGSQINAMGVYAWYHINALQKASRLANEPDLTSEQRQMITQSMLTDEGFALHFLEDMFAAGHVAGTWGEASQRLGTHNYYNQHGIEVYTWNREQHPVVLMGDAHMRPQDLELAATAIYTSIKQVIDFVQGNDTGYSQPHVSSASTEPEDFNVCINDQFPTHEFGHKYDIALREILFQTPMPGLEPGLGALPRIRSELGPFIGLAGTIDARLFEGGYLESQNRTGAIVGLDLSFRAGFGMDGVMDESGDGLVYGSFGFRSDSASKNNFSDERLSDQGGSIDAAIPARTGYSIRIRMPFYLFPTDLLWLSPLYLFDKDAYTQLAVTAGNGGLIPWQQGIATSIGRFQFVLGRELGATFYGNLTNDKIIIPSDTGKIDLVDFESILFDIPILEYRPYRSFSSNQSSSVVFQLYTSADVPQVKNVDILNRNVSLETVWSIGIRLVFDWRHY